MTIYFAPTSYREGAGVDTMPWTPSVMQCVAAGVLVYDEFSVSSLVCPSPMDRSRTNTAGVTELAVKCTRQPT